MTTLIILPTYNELDNLIPLIAQIQAKLPQTDILIIDDNSPDGTGELAERLARKNQRIKVIHRESKLGLGSAYIQGFKYALKNNYDFIFTMDADFSHNPDYLESFLAQTHRYSLILGSRYIPGGGVTNWEGWRKLLSYTANLYARIVLGLPYRDLTGGFKCYARELIQSLNLESIISEGYVFQIETTYRAHRQGWAIKEIPIIFQGRRRGRSKISRRICWEAIGKVLCLRLFPPT